ncbi:DUF421 domain-containing protein [Paenibacillus sp. HN-1]|uniref:DUF421 domain-containing protein n=1 Tax=Paenibacillus TaxID=44249 RepID=UPI001CA912C7|nr:MULTISPECIES: DUF421 domain-containing protein [Paenibacillus]MBY9079431.1 DUF421 domain-containing protein [Paenibacillus sp. CGMCC 1.18879]MBY9085726.1 DUF421 domain-containing protein [Paenibacillus sinensis]
MDDFMRVSFWEMTLRSITSFFVLLLFARLLGKKQLSQLTFFNYVTGITIGSIAADISAESETPFFNGLIALVWWFILTILIGYTGLKSSKARILFDGQPTIVVKEGKILKKALLRTRLNIDDLTMMLREKNVFSFQEVHYAILEPNGQISVLKKEYQQAVTKEDMNIRTPAFTYLPSEIISDGKIVQKNLRELNLTESWVHDELKKQGVQSEREVFYAEIQKDGSLFINK